MKIQGQGSKLHLPQRYIQVFKLWGPLDPFLKNLGVQCKVLGVQLIYSQQD